MFCFFFRLFVAGTQVSQQSTHFKNVNTIYIWALFKVFSHHGACSQAILIQRGRKVECKLYNLEKSTRDTVMPLRKLLN